jgi:hypothetical protein
MKPLEYPIDVMNNMRLMVPLHHQRVQITHELGNLSNEIHASVCRHFNVMPGDVWMPKQARGSMVTIDYVLVSDYPQFSHGVACCPHVYVHFFPSDADGNRKSLDDSMCLERFLANFERMDD